MMVVTILGPHPKIYRFVSIQSKKIDTNLDRTRSDSRH